VVQNASEKLICPSEFPGSETIACLRQEYIEQKSICTCNKAAFVHIVLGLKFFPSPVWLIAIIPHHFLVSAVADKK
jgi:hypothetical protein